MTTTLTLERAKEIVQAINSFGLATLDLAVADAKPLENVSLMEMCEAAQFVRDHDDAKDRDGDGCKSFSLVPDDRLTSAVYTLIHHTHDSMLDKDDDYIPVMMKGRSLIGNVTFFLAIGARETPADEDTDD
jgi:hypothetical protein